MVQTLTTLFEIRVTPQVKEERPVSTLAFDWLFMMLALLMSVGIMMDVWSHFEFGPDQSIFNEYHLLFYSALGAITMLLMGVQLYNVRQGYAFEYALPQGYGFGLLGALLFGISGVVDLSVHAMFGFESDIEALTSPAHLFLFITWAMMLLAPLKGTLARLRGTGQAITFWNSLPMLLAFGCVLFNVSIPLMEYFPMGNQPYFLQQWRADSTFYSLALGIAGTLLQTVVIMGAVLWFVRSTKVPFGGFTVAMIILGLFFTLINPDQLPIAMFFIFGLTLDLLYNVIQPDATRQGRFVLFAILGTLAMWAAAYGTYISLFGLQNIYFSGYNAFGSVAQAATLAAVMAYFLSMPAPQAQHATTEVSHA